MIKKLFFVIMLTTISCLYTMRKASVLRRPLLTSALTQQRRLTSSATPQKCFEYNWRVCAAPEHCKQPDLCQYELECYVALSPLRRALKEQEYEKQQNARYKKHKEEYEQRQRKREEIELKRKQQPIRHALFDFVGFLYKKVS